MMEAEAFEGVSDDAVAVAATALRVSGLLVVGIGAAVQRSTRRSIGAHELHEKCNAVAGALLRLLAERHIAATTVKTA